MKNEIKSLVHPGTPKALLLTLSIALIEALELTIKVVSGTLKVVWEIYSGVSDHSSGENEDDGNDHFNTTQNPYQ